MVTTTAIPELAIDPYRIDNLLEPYPMHEAIREAGPVVQLTSYPSLVACAQYEPIQAILLDHENFVNGAGVGLANFNVVKPFRPKSLLLETDPPLHTKTRGVISRILNPKAVSQLRDEFEKQAELLVERCVSKVLIDGIADFAEPYPLKVFPDAVGIEEEGRENLLLYGDMIFNGMGPNNDLLAKALERLNPVTDWIMDHCQRSRLRPGAMGDQIFMAADAGVITYEEAPMLVRSFLGAGVDTTIVALGNLLYAFTQFPDEYEKVRNNPSLLRAAFDETLRWESPLQSQYRTTIRDTQIAGVEVPANTKVLCFLAGANRDPRKWDSPDQYVIGRRPGQLGMGTGIHGCVGQAVARLEAEVLLAALIRRVKAIELAGEPVRRLNNALRGFQSLPLRLTLA